jgi:hypothetical protein
MEHVGVFSREDGLIQYHPSRRAEGVSTQSKVQQQPVLPITIAYVTSVLNRAQA